MVVGAVGSGKSSLISAVLGEMHRNKGDLTINGSVAYCSQQAWIVNDTLRNNVLFGLDMDEERYQKIIQACALTHDIELLPGGDMTEIGERGINLSGGQKQRVSLARALYSDRDIYFFDDPLSAVDAHVGKHIFEEAMQGVLKEKTRIMVTNQLQYLPFASQAIFMSGMEILEQGPPDVLMQMDGSEGSDDENNSGDNEKNGNGNGTKKRRKGEFQRLMKSQGIFQEEEEEFNQKRRKKKKDAKTQMNQEDLIEAEDREEGAVGITVMGYWIASGTMVLFLLGVGFILLQQSAKAALGIWLARFTSDAFNQSVEWYMLIYGCIGAAEVGFALAVGLLLVRWAVIASLKMHKDCIERVSKSPVSFFDTTPLGRVLNRFSKELDVVDLNLGFQFQNFLNSCGQLIAVVAVLAVSFPFILIAVAVLGVVYYFIQKYYRRTSREIQRLEAISRSPLYAHFSETLTGLPTIRSYSIQEQFIHRSDFRANHNSQAFYCMWITNQWLSLRLDWLGQCVLFAYTLILVLFKITGQMECVPNTCDDDTVDDCGCSYVLAQSLAGLGLSFAFQVNQRLNFVTTAGVQLESRLTSVERIKHYAKKLEQEAAYELLGTDLTNWPNKGALELRECEMRYRKNLDLVLKGVSFHVEAGEKVAIVGRTGAGKSSLMVALFRLTELEKGKIFIDGVDIGQIGLHDLRSKISIIPQDPVLFKGTVRFNLDPFNDHSDEEIWKTIEICQLKDEIENQGGGLESIVEEDGDNFSVGQRQLFCLGRALLRKPKILIMDEATASVDVETDALIQDTVRKEFKDSTVLTIAHRLVTIMDYDKVLVMHNGRVAEYDTPADLLRKNGILRSLVADTGASSSRNLLGIAFGKSAEGLRSADDIFNQMAENFEADNDNSSMLLTNTASNLLRTSTSVGIRDSLDANPNQ